MVGVLESPREPRTFEEKGEHGQSRKKEKSEAGRVRKTAAGMQVCFAPPAYSLARLLTDIIPGDTDKPTAYRDNYATFGEPLSTEKAAIR